MALPRPYDAPRLFAFLASRAIPGVESIQVDEQQWRYRRALRLSRGSGLGEVHVAQGHARLTARTLEAADGEAALDALERVLDLAPTPSQVDAELSRHASVRSLIGERPGLRVPRAADRDEVAFRALIGQQVSVAAASTTCGVIAEQYGEDLPLALQSSDVVRVWPRNATIASLDPQLLRMPRAKATAVVTLATALRDGRVDLTQAPSTVREQLVSLRGIGPWTAGYVSMRACGDNDVLLDGDLIVRRGAALIGFPETPRALRAATDTLSPWRSYLTMHLWQVYAARTAKTV